MTTIRKISITVIISAMLAACGGSSAKDEKGKLGDMKVKLEKLKKEKAGLDEQIRQVEEQIAKADPEAAKQVQKLVSVDTVRTQNFSHYIELQGKIDPGGVAYVAPSGQGGVIKAIYVSVGSQVRQGQVVLKLDDVMQRQALQGNQQSADVVRSRLSQAQTMYQKRQNLWQQNIGAEIDVINAKADVDALQSQLRAAEANVAAAREQVNQTNVTAQMSGVVDRVDVKVGELFSGATASMGGIQIVNNSRIKMTANVPENYIGRVKKGDSVHVVVQETGKPYFRSVISAIGAAIDPKTRSFVAEANLPADPFLKPNQTATMKILDYKANNVVSVPINVVQTDDKGKYLYIVVKEGDKTVARKKVVNVGQAYGGMMEIKGGINGGDVIITEGYQTVYDGQSIKTGM